MKLSYREISERKRWNGEMAQVQKSGAFKSGNRVKINTGSKYIPSLENYCGTVVSCTEDDNVFLVQPDDEPQALRINISRISRI